jgi:hypothetical protein
MLFVVQVAEEYTGLSANSLNLVAVRRHFSDCAPATLLHYLLCHRLWHVGELLKLGNLWVVRELGFLGIPLPHTLSDESFIQRFQRSFTLFLGYVAAARQIVNYLPDILQYTG